MKRFLSGIHIVNLGLIAVQVLQIVPQKPWVIALQAVLAAVLPSFGGVGHKAFFGNAQDPAR